MFNLVSEDDAANVLGIFFVFEFGGMNADDNQLVRIFLLQPLEIRNDVNAVDAAVGPEVEQDNFALQPSERKRLVRVQPAAMTGEFRCTNSWAFLCRHVESFR